MRFITLAVVLLSISVTGCKTSVSAKVAAAPVPFDHTRGAVETVSERSRVLPWYETLSEDELVDLRYAAPRR